MADHFPGKQMALGVQILENCRSALYGMFPQLDGAFGALRDCPDVASTTVGTEGERLVFSPEFLIRRFGQNPAAVRRGYLHLLLHCLYLHPFWQAPEDLHRWDLACDMAVEYMLERLERPELALPPDALRMRCFACMQEQNVSAQTLYTQLGQGAFPFSLEQMQAAFCFDDHKLWYGRRGIAAPDAARQKWEALLQYTNQGRKGGRRGTNANGDVHTLAPDGGQRYDYRRFLRQFAVEREEAELDIESFDYILYHYGMQRYGNLPLIEPLEYRQACRMEELVIAIDTSGSCSRETVARFLGQTYQILSEKENFFSTMKIYLIQCDCVVQSVTCISNAKQWLEQANQIVIRGRGGTDFTPVFRYVDKLRTQKALRGPRALLYFTDGDGVYPRQKPDYETAFVFLQRTQKTALVPDWARCLVLNDIG